MKKKQLQDQTRNKKLKLNQTMTEESKRNKKSNTEINSSKTQSKLNPKKKTIKKVLKPETIKHNLHKKKKLRSLKDLFQLRRQNM